MTKIKTIFVDFDGVLFDSVKEAYLLSRFAYKSISPLISIDESEYLKFRNLRYLITKSWHFYYVWQMLENPNLNKDYFYNCIATPDVEKCTDFDNKYIYARKFLIDNHFEFWNQLDTPFDFLYAIKELSELSEYKVVILSNKKRLPIINKLKLFDINTFQVFANEDITSTKCEFIKSYFVINGKSEAYFIDDSIDNLNECAEINDLTRLHAGWGYTNGLGLSQKEILRIIGYKYED